MAVNQHIIDAELLLLRRKKLNGEHKLDSNNKNQESKKNSNNYLKINEDFIYKIRFNSFSNLDNVDKLKHERVISIENVKTFEDGLKLITHRDFAKLIQSSPFVFVIIINYESERFTDKKCILSLLKQRYRTKRPLIVVFQNNDPKIYYKNHGYYSRFVEYIADAIDDNVTDFGTLLMNFEANEFGYYNGLFEDITINNKDAAQQLINNYAKKKDLLVIRFIHLFDASLRPDLQSIRNILCDDYENIQLDGFSAIFDFNIYDHGSRCLIKSQSTSGHDVHLILSTTFSDQENLLMVAIRCHNKKAVEFLISCGINLNLSNGKYTREIAADIAYNTKQYNILLMLLNANSRFPHEFSYKSELKNFIDLTERLHMLIEEINENDEQSNLIIEEIRNIIEAHPNLDYWYDLSNKSAATKAILLKKFKTYNFLLQNGLFIGPFEDIEAIKNTLLEESEQDQIRRINAENAHKLSNNYLLILQLNSFVWKEQKAENPHIAKSIEKAFKILDENELIRPILQIVAEAKSFRIIFDFNRNSVEALDFTSHTTTYGIFYLGQSHIYIGAKDLLDKGSMEKLNDSAQEAEENEVNKHRTIAILAHELCHFAVLLTYRNMCNPYAKCDEIKKKKFEEILLECKQRKEIEYLIKLVFGYKPERQHAELIVRVPHMIIQYRNESDKVNSIKNTYSSLFEYYEKHVIKDIKNTINNVKQSFFENLKFEHEFWQKKKRKQKIMKYLLILAVALIAALSGFSVMLMTFMEPCITFNRTCNADNLFEWTLKGISNTVVKYNNKYITLHDVTRNQPELMKFLSNDEIRLPSSIIINEQDLSLPFRYHKRLFTNSNYYFAKDTKCSYKHSNKYEIDSYELKSEQKIHLICDEPVAGKTMTLKFIANEKRISNLKWVIYLNLKIFSDISDYMSINNWTMTNITNFLVDAHNMDTKNKKINYGSFENEIFRKKFEDGEIILLIDHIDWMYMENEIFADKFLKSLLKIYNKNSELWFTTRMWFSDKIKQTINDTVEGFAGCYKLVPLYCESREIFINETINDNNISADLAIKVHERLNDVFKIANQWRDWKNVEIDNICLLNIILNHTIMSVVSNTTDVNHYKIFEAYVVNILAVMSHLNLHDMNNYRQQIDKVLTSVALRYVEVNYSLKDVKMNELIQRELYYINRDERPENKFTVYYPNGTFWNQLSPKIINEIKRGILKIKENKIEFHHKIYAEYYIAKYIYDEMWDKNKWNPQDPIFKQKLLFLLNIFKDTDTQFPLIQKFITEIVVSVQQNDEYRITYNKDFRDQFKNLYANFTYGSNIDVGLYIIKLFDDDEDMKRTIQDCSKEQIKHYRSYRNNQMKNRLNTNKN